MCLNTGIFRFRDVSTAKTTAQLLTERDPDGWFYCVESYPCGCAKIKAFTADGSFLGYL